jgi:hypothetical protein
MWCAMMRMIKAVNIAYNLKYIHRCDVLLASHYGRYYTQSTVAIAIIDQSYAEHNLSLCLKLLPHCIIK